MELSQKGLDLIKSFEGLRLKAYKAVSTEKYYTIGYGHYGSDVKENAVITKERAEQLLKQDCGSFVKAVNQMVKVKLTQNQFDALVSFTYNCGAGALQRSDLLKYLNEGDYKKSAAELPRWNKSGDKVLAGLVKRRAKEMELFLSDVAEEKEETKKEVKSNEQKETIKTYVVVSSIPGYVNAADAKSKKNKKATVKAGTYYVFNESQGMVNVTSKKGVPGNWINPSENVNEKYYYVKSGDTVSGIAAKEKTTVANIKKLNPQIKNINLIYPNQKIRVK